MRQIAHSEFTNYELNLKKHLCQLSFKIVISNNNFNLEINFDLSVIQVHFLVSVFVRIDIKRFCFLCFDVWSLEPQPPGPTRTLV